MIPNIEREVKSFICDKSCSLPKKPDWSKIKNKVIYQGGDLERG